MHLRVDAAKSIIPYIYPKLQSVDVNGRDGQPLIVQILRFADDLPDERQMPPMIEMGENAVIDAVAAPVAVSLSDEDEDDR